MYQEQAHGLPHVHVDLRDRHHAASYAIDPPRLLAGAMEKRYEHAVLDWIWLHRKELNALWSTLQAGGDGREIIVSLSKGE